MSAWFPLGAWTACEWTAVPAVASEVEFEGEPAEQEKTDAADDDEEASEQ